MGREIPGRRESTEFNKKKRWMNTSDEKKNEFTTNMNNNFKMSICEVMK